MAEKPGEDKAGVKRALTQFEIQAPPPLGQP